MLMYSAKMQLPSGETFRMSLRAKNYDEACVKGKSIPESLSFEADFVDVFLVGTKEDKQGFYSAERPIPAERKHHEKALY